MKQLETLDSLWKKASTNPTVSGWWAMLPAKTTGTTINAATTTSSFVLDAARRRPRLNLSNRREIGNRAMTVSQTKENIWETTTRLPAAEAYRAPLKTLKQITDMYGAPVLGTSLRKTPGTTRWRASCAKSSQALRIPVRQPPHRTTIASTTIHVRSQRPPAYSSHIQHDEVT